MTTADELLTAGDVLWIDVETRLINIPSGVKILGVMSDDDVQKLHFAMPRYYNDIDLSEYDININYENAKGEGDVYFVTDAVVETDTITFTWIVGRYATTYTGDVDFIVCLKKLNSDEEIESEFNTTIATLPVLKGLETGAAVVEAERDALSAIAAMAIEEALDSDLKGDPGYTPVKGTDYYTDAEKEEFVTEVIQRHNAVTANSFVGTASGEVIRVDDVNPIEHTVKVKVSCKNILPDSVYDKSKWLLVEGTTNNYVFPISLKEEETYTFSATMIDGSFGYFYIEKSNDSFLTNSDMWLSTPNNSAMPFTFTTEKGFEYRLFWYEGTKFVTDLATDLQLEIGDTATEYEPYIDPTSVTVTRCGKNLLDVSATGTNLSNTSGWASIAYNKDYTKKILHPSTSYTMRFKATGVEDVSYATIHSYRFGFGLYDFTTNKYIAMATNGEGSVGEWLTKGKSIEITETFTTPDDLLEKDYTIIYYTQAAYLEDGTSVRNRLSFTDIQIEFGATATDYESYKAATYTPTADGSCEIVSVSPTMTILTDTPVVTIECEYGADTNTALRDLERALDNIIAVQEALIGGGSA